MKKLISASSIWMLVLFTSLSTEVNTDEKAGNLLLSLDCEGQLFVPVLEAHFNFSERLLGALWDIDDLRSYFSPCDFKDKGCYSKFIFQVALEEVFTIERHLQPCPNRKWPAASFICVGDTCSKILTPCETSSDCGKGLYCPQKRSYRSEYHSEITSELFSFLPVNGLAGIPVEGYTNVTRFLGLEVNLEDTTKWVVYSRLLNETLIIDSCGASSNNALINVKVTPGIYELFSIKSCAYHLECTSGVCIIPPKETAKDKEGELFLRAIYGFEPQHQGFCLPWIQLNYTFWFSNQEYINELIRMAKAVHVFDHILPTRNKQIPKELDNKFEKNGSELSGIFNAILWFIGLLSVARLCCREYNNQNEARTH